MIPPHAPPYPDTRLSLFENIHTFYSWYRQKYQCEQPRSCLLRLLIISKNDLLSSETEDFVCDAFSELSDELRSASIPISRIGESLLRIEQKVTYSSERAALQGAILRVIMQIGFKDSDCEELKSIVNRLDKIQPKHFSPFQAKVASRLLELYLHSPESLSSLREFMHFAGRCTPS